VTYPGQVITFQISLAGSQFNLPESNITISPVGGAPLPLVSGDVNGDSILQTDETWVYTVTHVVTAADLTPGSELNFQFQGSGKDTNGVIERHSGFAIVAATGPIRIVNLVSGDGGANWYVSHIEPHDTIQELSALTGLTPNALHLGTPLFQPGASLQELFVVQNVSPQGLTNVTLADTRYDLSTVSIGALAPGAVFKTMVAGTTAYGAPVTDVFTAKAMFDGLSVGDTHTGDYDAYSNASFQQGPEAHDVAYWSKHPEAWVSNVVKVTNSDGINQPGVWVGAVDPSTTPAAQGALFVPIEAVRQLLATNGGDDLRLGIAAQAIAAQFNLDAGVHVPGASLGALSGDLLSEAVAFLYGSRTIFDAYRYHGASISGEDVGGSAGYLSVGPKDTFDYNTRTHEFSSPKTALDSSEAVTPHQYVARDGGDFFESGVGLESALNLFNTNHLVTDSLGQTVGWDASGTVGGPYTLVGLNLDNDFWSVLHTVTTGTGLFEGIL
jgi:hypothetical protein